MQASQERRLPSSIASSTPVRSGLATATGMADEYTHEYFDGLNTTSASRSPASRLMPSNSAVSPFSETHSASSVYGGEAENTSLGKANNLSATSLSSFAAQQYGYRSASPSPGFAAAHSPSPSPTPSGRGLVSRGYGPGGIDRYAASAYSPPSTADSSASGALHAYGSNAPAPAKSPLGANGGVAPATASSNSSPFARAAQLPRFPHIAGITPTTSTSGMHSRHSSGHASSLGGHVSSNSSHAAGAGLTPSSMSSAAALDASYAMAQGVSGLTASLTRVNLDADPRSAQMFATGSYDSISGHSSSSSNQRPSSMHPSFPRHSFSDGTANPFGGNDASSTLTPFDYAQQLRLAGATQASIPVSLPATGPLSASDPRTQLHVNNLPYRVRWQDLKDLFRRAGTVLRADVSLTPDNRSRGFGTVLMATDDDARRACDMFKGFNWQGRTLDVKIDRSGTLLGIGVGQLNAAAALLGAGAAAGQTVSPIPTSLAPFAGSAPFAPALAFTPNSGGPFQQQQQQPPPPPPPTMQLPAGISPALLPFLGTSSRASIGSSMSHAAQPWPSAQAEGGAQQQRALSFSAGHTSASGGSSPFTTHAGAGHPSPFNPAAAPAGQQQHLAYPANPSLPQPPAAGLPQSTSYMGRVLFVGNLPFHCQWQDLKDLFRAAGNIQRADVALTAEGKSRGFGTVLFASPEDAQNAVRIYHGYEYSGRTLKVHFDRFAQSSAPPSGALPASPSQYTGAFAAANTPTTASNNAAPPQAPYNAYHQQPQQQQQMRMQQQGQARFFDPAQHAFPYHQQQQQQQHQQQNPMFNQSNLYGLAGTFPSQQNLQHQPYTQPFGYGDGLDMFNPMSPQGGGRAFSTTSASTSNDGRDRRVASLSSSVDSERGSSGQGEGAHKNDDTIGGSKSEEPPSSDDGQAKHQSKALSGKMGMSDGTHVGSGAPHPGRITLPPQQAFAQSRQAQYQQDPNLATPYSPTNGRMSVPMTPGMPGFSFHVVPETPPVPHHFLSPGLNGPFSPPLIASPYGGPATPGASSRPFNPTINPAPGAPIHFNSGGVTTPMASMMQIHQPNFNPMFPPIGMSYQPVNATSSSQQLPQTPHWSQPRPPQGQQMQNVGQHREQTQGQGRAGVAAPAPAAPASAAASDAASDQDGGAPAAGSADASGHSPGVLEGSYPFSLVQPLSSALMQRRASTNSAAVNPTTIKLLDGADDAQTKSSRWDQRRGSMHVGEASAADGSGGDTAAAAATTTVAGMGMHAMHGATSTEALARRIAQLSAEKALRQQQRERVGSAAAEEATKGRASSSNASTDSRQPWKGSVAGSALDDSASTPGSAASEG